MVVVVKINYHQSFNAGAGFNSVHNGARNQAGYSFFAATRRVQNIRDAVSVDHIVPKMKDDCIAIL
jgi:hypothetical protein